MLTSIHELPVLDHPVFRKNSPNFLQMFAYPVKMSYPKYPLFIWQL